MKKIIVTHGDADGICAGAIVLRKYKTAECYFTQPFSLDRTLGKVKGKCMLFILDISVDEKNFHKVRKKLINMKSKDVFVVWIDHHHSSLKRQADLEKITDVCEVDVSKSASRLVYEMIGLGHDLAEIGDAGDKYIRTKEPSEYAKLIGAAISFEPSNDKYREEVMRELASGLDGVKAELKEKAGKANEKLRSLISAGEVLYENGKVLVKKYGTEAYGYAAGVSGILAKEKNKVIIILSEVEKSPGLLVISSRQPFKQNTYNMATVMKRTRNFGGSGGGHPDAAGGRIDASKVNEFVKWLTRYFR